jgi:type IV pilus assembly protein PilO
MAMKKINLKVDFSALQGQFQGLQGRHPGLWPAIPKSALLLGLVSALFLLAYFFYWSGLLEELESGRNKEATLKTAFTDKMKQAVNLDVLRRQKEQVSQYVTVLEKQLPSKAEMDALLSDINQAGVGRGLQFELFKPGAIGVKEYYAELPINIRLVGNYHDLGAFTSDISNLPRIVTLNNLSLSQPPNEKAGSGALILEAVAKTFRYLDADEIAAQRAAAAKAKAGAAGAGAEKSGAKPSGK